MATEKSKLENKIISMMINLKNLFNLETYNRILIYCLLSVLFFGLYFSQLRWFTEAKSVQFSARSLRYLDKRSNSLSLSRFKWASLNGLILRPFFGFIIKLRRISSNMIVFFEENCLNFPHITPNGFTCKNNNFSKNKNNEMIKF